ncbi:peptidase M61 [Adhaeribacter aerolatus]|uniref:Peptidase M61 n=1 Tax=Adhaeribacter aerolatus TaxID=670289 RepID=A0A512AYS4_9BACT|nr:peptidase M61 [Adhaeribacter aerolatus]GEO04850.1 peptidase M61 [Adhaeribacter aerolatus]
MRKLWLLLLVLSLRQITFASDELIKNKEYQFTLNLTRVQNDRIQVTLKAPEIKESEIIYNMPKMVPGTYSVYNFGKFISDFKATDKKGRTLPVTQLDENRWKIGKAKDLDQITYWASDTFDNTKKEDLVFEPAGTNIEENKNFLLNTHGFIGYFDGMKRVPYELTIIKPQQFYGSTPLKAVKTTPTADTYRIDSYMEVVDAPLMYNVPDTAMMHIGGAEVLVSVYTAKKDVQSDIIAQNIKEILEAQKNYLGGKLPVEKYAFLIYVDDAYNTTGSYGALEHSYSSVYYLPPFNSQQIANQIRGIAAHEFFHIVTPLNIHSEEIGDFDYINPKMSKHLWLYEGVTEYFASHVQVNQKLISPEEYLIKLRSYIAGSLKYNDTLPFTVLSKGALDVHENQYGNVYQKGALIGLALDIRLRELSGGKYGIRNLMNDLAKTYGKNRSFKDEELFDKITELTYPQIREFFRKHVEGSQPIPYSELFNTVGIIYAPQGTDMVNTFGQIIIGQNKEGQVVISGTDNMNDFGKKMGYQEGDVILEINGEAVTSANLPKIVAQQVTNAPVGSELKVTVSRKSKKGNSETLTLKGNLTQTSVETTHLLRLDPAATEMQKQLRQAWLFSGLQAD